MPVSNYLEIPQITESQANKATAFNEAVTMMERAITDTYDLVTTGVASGDVVLQYDPTDELSDREALRFIYLNIQSGATGAFNIIHPNNRHLFFVKNGSAVPATIKTLDGLGPIVVPGQGQIVYCDGTDCVGLLAGGTQVKAASDFSVNYYGQPTEGETLGLVLVTRDTTFLANFFGAVCIISGVPAIALSLEVKAGATLIGNVNISSGGAITYSTVGAVDKVVLAGTQLTLVCPSTEPGLSNIRLAIPGTVAVNQ